MLQELTEAGTAKDTRRAVDFNPPSPQLRNINRTTKRKLKMAAYHQQTKSLFYIAVTQKGNLPRFVSSEEVPLHQKQRLVESGKTVTCRVDETEWAGEHSVQKCHHDLWLPLLLGSTKYWYLKEPLRGKKCSLLHIYHTGSSYKVHRFDWMAFAHGSKLVLSKSRTSK